MLATISAIGLAASLPFSSPAAADPVEPPAGTAGLVLDIGFGDGVATESAGGFEATLHGDPTFGTSPDFGDIVDLDGVDDAISFPSDNVWDELDEAFTLECAFRINQGMTWTSERNLCASKEAGGLSMYARSGELGIMAHIDGGWVRATHPISGNHWYHAAGRWDGSELSLWIDGELVGSTPAVGELAPPTETARHFVVGADAGKNGIVQLFSPESSFGLARLYSRALDAEEIGASAAPWQLDDCELTPVDAPAVVLDELFCEDALPAGWQVHSGQWAVSDSSLQGSGERHSASRITFGPHLDDFRLDARVRIDAVADETAWLAFGLDMPVDGDGAWLHAGMRADTTAANSTEFALRDADGSYAVAAQYERTPATPVGTWFDVSLVMHGSVGEWWYNGELIGTTTGLTRSDDGVLGIIADGMEVSLDRVTVTELDAMDTQPQCLPEGDEIRSPGQAGYAVGHRGAMTNQPENTIPAFQYAVDNGALWVELDITWTSDEEIVVIHDDTVDRTHEGTGAVKDMTLEEFKALDVKGYPGLKSPTFAEFLEWLKESGVNASIEYKGDFPLEMAQKTADLIRAHEVTEQSAALSFSLVSIENMRTVMPELERHVNLSEIPEDPVAFAEQYGASSLTWRNPTPPAEVVAALHEAGVKLNSGTTDSLGSWEAAAALGVDGITVNDPAAYAEWLAAYNERNGFVVCDEPEPTPDPTPTATPEPTATPPSQGGTDVYTVPGFHNVNGRWWSTSCEPYSQTIRCRTDIWATQVADFDGRFVATTGWHFNNLTYLPHMTRQQWADNPLGHAGQWSADDGRQWRTECDTANTGRNGCRSYVQARFVAGTQGADGSWSYSWKQDWVFNNMVRFSG